MIVRKMQSGDIDAMMAIYNYYIANTNNNWQRETRPRTYYQNWFRSHKSTYPVFILEEDGEAVGFACLSRFREKVDGYDRVAENTLYILPQHMGKGGGKQLMQALIDQAKALGLWAISAWIDSDNVSSIDFHKRFGFYETGVLKNVGNKGEKRLSVSILQLDL